MRIVELKNGQKAIIRQAFKIDAEDIIKHNNKIGKETDFLSFGKEGFNITIEQEESFIDNLNNEDNSMMVVAEVDKQIVCVASILSGSKIRFRHNGELGIGIQQAYCSLGLGEAVIKYLLEWARGNGITRKVTLVVRTDNYRAIKLYEKLGFEIEGTLKNDMLLDGVFYDAYTMGLMIN